MEARVVCLVMYDIFILSLVKYQVMLFTYVFYLLDGLRSTDKNILIEIRS